MKQPSRINSPSIDIEAFFEGLSWDDDAEVQGNLAALMSGTELLRDAVLNNLIVTEPIEFSTLTRTLQDSDPMFRICKILEVLAATQTGDARRFKEVAADLSLLREIVAGLVKYAPAAAGEEVRANAFTIYRELLPKIHARFVASGDSLLRWKAAVILEQQVDFVGRHYSENENIAESGAMLAWGNDYLSAISDDGTEGKKAAEGTREFEPLLAELKSHCLQLLQSEIKHEVEHYEDTIVLTPATHEHALSGFSELIFRAKKEAEKGATFRLTLDFEAVPVAAPAGERTGPIVPVRPIHLKQRFQTSYVQMDEIRKLIDGFVTPLREDVKSGTFKDQDSQSLEGWFTDSIVPWVQATDGITVENE